VQYYYERHHERRKMEGEQQKRYNEHRQSMTDVAWVIYKLIADNHFSVRDAKTILCEVEQHVERFSCVEVVEQDSGDIRTFEGRVSHKCE